MKINLKKILTFRNMLWIILILLVLIVGYNVFVYLKLYEGVVNLDKTIKINNVRKIIIQPYGSNEWLNIGEIVLHDINNNIILYTTTATKFRIKEKNNWSWKMRECYDRDNPAYNTSKLYDGSKDTMFHSAGVGCTLTITPSDINKVVAKITIRNRQDCCQNRLDRYQLVLQNINNDNIIPPILLKNVPNLFNVSSPNTPYTEEIILPKDPKDGTPGAPGEHGEPGAPGAPGVPGAIILSGASSIGK